MILTICNDLSSQEGRYESVVQELQNGRKRGHWMWYIFPQIAGLGVSSTSQMYAIKSNTEAIAYFEHSLLGPRLTECTQHVINVTGRTTKEILGYVDSLKFRSCMTLFSWATKAAVFEDALNKYFDNEADELTLNILKSQND